MNIFTYLENYIIFLFMDTYVAQWVGHFLRTFIFQDTVKKVVLSWYLIAYIDK